MLETKKISHRFSARQKKLDSFDLETVGNTEKVCFTSNRIKELCLCDADVEL